MTKASADLAYAAEVLEGLRFVGLDQNPKGIRDIIGSVVFRIRELERKLEEKSK